MWNCKVLVAEIRNMGPGVVVREFIDGFGEALVGFERTKGLLWCVLDSLYEVSAIGVVSGE